MAGLDLAAPLKRLFVSKMQTRLLFPCFGGSSNCWGRSRHQWHLYKIRRTSGSAVRTLDLLYSQSQLLFFLCCRRWQTIPTSAVLIYFHLAASGLVGQPTRKRISRIVLVPKRFLSFRTISVFETSSIS